MIGRLASVSGFTALSRVVGFLRDMMLAAILGAGPISDAFLVSFRLPNHFRAIFAEGAFNAAFLPRYTARTAAHGDLHVTSAAARFANDVFAWQIAVQIILLVVALLGMHWIVAMLAPGFTDNPAQMDLTVRLTRITFPYLICIAIVTQLSAMLNAIHRFKAAAAAPVFLNLAMIGTLACARWFPSAAYAAAWGVLISGILQLVFLSWAARRSGLMLRLKWPRWRPEMREFAGALGAASIGSGSVQIGLFVDTLIASFLPAGDLTALYYADRINQLPMGIIGVALGTVLLPEMSAKLAAGDERGASLSQNRAIVLGLLLTLPCIAAFFTIPNLTMRALFARGNFDMAAADKSAAVLIAYGAGLPAFVLMRCIVSSFYARGDTATPVRATLISVAANIALKFALVWGLSMGAVGIALGTSVAAWVNLLVLVILARRGEILVATNDLKRGLAPVFAAALAAAAGFAFGDWVGARFVPAMHLRNEIVFVIAGLCGAIAYGAIVTVLRKRLPFGQTGAGKGAV
jgi:putative peptidoglycan lipid II flippase